MTDQGPCFESGPETDDEMTTSCMLEIGHDGPHEWMRDDQIVISAPAERDPFTDPKSAGLIARKPEHRLSGEQDECARADHAAGSRSSDGSDTDPFVSPKHKGTI